MTILVPPTIVDGRSSNDLVVREKDRVNLTCEATGYPRPQILWRREDGKHIMASGVGSDKGEFLKIFILTLDSGETEWNREGKLQGQTDIELNQTGRDQASKASQRLKEGPKMHPTLCRSKNLGERIGPIFQCNMLYFP